MICRAKCEKSEDKSKFFMLKRNRSGQKPAGLIQGVVHSAEFGPKGLVICTENGSYLELKVSYHFIIMTNYRCGFLMFTCCALFSCHHLLLPTGNECF